MSQEALAHLINIQQSCKLVRAHLECLLAAVIGSLLIKALRLQLRHHLLLHHLRCEAEQHMCMLASRACIPCLRQMTGWTCCASQSSWSADPDVHAVLSITRRKTLGNVFLFS